MHALRASLPLLILFICLSGPVSAQQGSGTPEPTDDQTAEDPNGGTSTDSQTGDGTSDDSNDDEPATTDAPSGDETSVELLDRAREAFREAEYGRIVPTLAPIMDEELRELTEEQRSDARQLYAVGLFFQAQQAQSVAERDGLLDNARAVFLELLREDPEFQLDPLLYPASIVELFDEVVEANAEEISKLREKLRREEGGPAEIETVYIQREATKNRFGLVFLPFAVGQFQNGDLIKGTLLASVQAGALALNFTSFLVIESLRNQEDGRYDVESGNYANALAWRNVLYGSLITFGIAYIVSVVDAWTFFEAYDVNIRTLDGPPPELTDLPGSESSAHPLGFSFEMAW